mmetsp:Transcript_51453/g.132760  ORF Transcript_51453/g.132760 Transcript_51453/m.132760 type:complete len:390 (+) Transcript_51453:68-1237(+)
MAVGYSSEVIGMICISTAAVSSQIALVLSKVMNEWHMPFYFLLGGAEIFALCPVLAAIIYIKGERSKLKVSDLKWVSLRGFFGALNFVLAMLAIHVGAPLGDASALSSINVVVAAVLGRAFLGEPLRLPHIAALVCSITGAFMISKPDALLGLRHIEGGVPWLGYLLALASGSASGTSFIASRKSQTIPGTVMAFSVAVQEGLGLFLLVITGLVVEHPAEQISAAPLKVTACFALLFFVMVVGIFAMNAGSQLCPAVVSSTMCTSLQMTVGYVAQTLITKDAPDMLSITGALLMLAAVAIMALARWMTPPSAAQSWKTGTEVEAGTLPVACEIEDSTDMNSDETDSLGSFIAAELSGLTPTSETVRQRRMQVATHVAATIVGAGVDVAA